MAETAPTFRALVARFTDFLTVMIHTILYEREIYPKTSFLSARKFNFAIRQNRHPKVCEWINDAVTAVESEILKGTVERIAVVVFDKSNQPRERFVFDVSHLPIIPSSELDTPLNRTGPDGEKIPVMPNVDMEEQFRATLSKVSNCKASLKALPQGCSFTISIELKSDGEAPIAHPQPWIPVQPDLRSDDNSTRRSTKPLRAVSAGDMMFECWIEESKQN